MWPLPPASVFTNTVDNIPRGDFRVPRQIKPNPLEPRASSTLQTKMKLFIGNLSYETTDQEVMDLLKEFEPILEFHRPLNRETGQPRGFAFATLKDEETGQAAITKLESTELGGRKLAAKEAEDRRQQSFQRRAPDTSERNERKDARPLDADGKPIRYKAI